MRDFRIGAAILLSALILGFAVHGGYIYVDGVSPPQRDTVSIPAEPDSTLTDPESSRFRKWVEFFIHQRVNDRRAEHGLDELAFDADLRRIARNHSSVMAKQDAYGHVEPDGDKLGDRYEQAGYRCSGGGENIAWTVWETQVDPNYGNNVVHDSARDVARGLVFQWMNSSGHRENILSKQFDLEGIGIYYEESTGRIYATQNFC